MSFVTLLRDDSMFVVTIPRRVTGVNGDNKMVPTVFHRPRRCFQGNTTATTKHMNSTRGYTRGGIQSIASRRSDLVNNCNNRKKTGTTRN
jgi:hypothetical protein